MTNRAIFFIESDFDTAIPGAAIVRSPFRRHNKFKRLIVDCWYVVRLLFAPYKAVVIAPWGLFWAPGILKRIGLKKFVIISLSCDTFLSEKTKANRSRGLVPRMKYWLAAYTHPAVNSFFFCSDLVHEQLVGFGVPQKKCVYQYREWIRDAERYERFRSIRPSLETNAFLFIGHCYGVLQKRADLLAESFLKVRAKHPLATLTIVGRGWPEFFGAKRTEVLRSQGIILTGENYDIDGFLSHASFLVHPGELEGFGLSVIEGMLAGLIPLVSNQTGSRDAAAAVDPCLVFPLSVDAMAERLEWAISLSSAERQALSKRAREIGTSYRASESVPALRNELINIIRHL